MALPIQTRPDILLVDDHPAVREALGRLLEENGVNVFAQAGGRQEALNLVREAKPRLALVDLSLNGEDGLVLVSDLRALGISVLVCSTHEEPEFVRRALAAGARAYVTKREATRDLARAVQDVLDGWVLISPRAADDLPEGL